MSEKSAREYFLRAFQVLSTEISECFISAWTNTLN